MDIPQFIHELAKYQKYFKWQIRDGRLIGLMYNLCFCPITALYTFVEHQYLPLIAFHIAADRFDLSVKDRVDITTCTDNIDERKDEPVSIMLLNCVGLQNS